MAEKTSLNSVMVASIIRTCTWLSLIDSTSEMAENTNHGGLMVASIGRTCTYTSKKDGLMATAKIKTDFTWYSQTFGAGDLEQK